MPLSNAVATCLLGNHRIKHSAQAFAVLNPAHRRFGVLIRVKGVHTTAHVDAVRLCGRPGCDAAIERIGVVLSHSFAWKRGRRTGERFRKAFVPGSSFTRGGQARVLKHETSLVGRYRSHLFATQKIRQAATAPRYESVGCCTTKSWVRKNASHNPLKRGLRSAGFVLSARAACTGDGTHLSPQTARQR